MTAGEVYLVYVNAGQRALDSVPIKDGAYVFQGEVSEEGPAYLLDRSPNGPARLDEPHVAQIYLTPGVWAVAHTDSFSNTTFTGSDINTRFRELQDAEKPYNRRETDLVTRYQAAHAAGDSATMAALEKENDRLHGEADAVYAAFARQHPASPLSLYALQQYASRDMDPGKLQPIFDSLDGSVKGSKQGKAFGERLEIAQKTAIGMPAPDFTQNDTAGKPITLSSYRGKYVLLDFWASWCRPCRAENPNLVDAYTRYHPKGFVILSVSLDRSVDRDQWLAAIHKDHLAWTQVSDLQLWNNAVAKEYGINSIPQNFLIDPDGRIIGKTLRGEALEKRLAGIYGE
jgi:peroxiredoxin